MIYRNSEEFKREKIQQIKELAEKRSHTLISGSYETKESELVVRCNIHNEIFTTTFYNYQRSKSGLACCGKQRTSKALKGRVYSEETLKKMSVAALKRPLRGGKPRKWRKTFRYNEWHKKAMAIWKYRCALTGERLEKGKKNLTVHHLISASLSEKLCYFP